MSKPNTDKSCKDLATSKLFMYRAGAHGPNFVLPEVTCVSEIFKSEDEFPFCRDRFVYRVYLTNLTSPVSFVFSGIERANESRQNLIMALINFWGAESVLFANGFDGWMTVKAAIRGASSITMDGCTYCFDIEVAKVEHSIPVVFSDLDTALAIRNQLTVYLENIRIDRSRLTKLRAAG